MDLLQPDGNDTWFVKVAAFGFIYFLATIIPSIILKETLFNVLGQFWENLSEAILAYILYAYIIYVYSQLTEGTVC